MLVNKHFHDGILASFVGSTDFSVTSMERGLSSWEHGFLVTALDIVNAYQKERMAIGVMGLGMHRHFASDSRTRFVELLKCWLRTNATKDDLTEDDVRRMSGLCQDLLNYSKEFPQKNEQGFLQTIGDVDKQLQLHLADAMKRDCLAGDSDEVCTEILTPPNNAGFSSSCGTGDSGQGCGVASLLVSADDTKRELASLEEASTCSTATSLQQTDLPAALPSAQQVAWCGWKTGSPTALQFVQSHAIGAHGAFLPALQSDTQRQPHASSVLSPEQRLSESASSPPPAFERNVWRLSQSRFGPYQCRHDRRSLRLIRGRLQIYQKGSTTAMKVESAISDLSELAFEGTFLRFMLKRFRVRHGWSRADSGDSDGELKAYAFEFDSMEVASEFEVQLRKQEAWAQRQHSA